MNSFRVLAGSRQPPVAADFDPQLLGSIGPLDRASASIALGEDRDSQSRFALTVALM
jgi:hypothetical protein